MTEPTAYKQILTYMDQLHQDLGQLLLLLEKLMVDAGHQSLHGNRACWDLSSHYAYPEKWRVPYIARCFVPDEDDDHSATETRFYLADLAPDTIYGFPSLLCGTYHHDRLTGPEVATGVFNTPKLRSLTRDGSEWTHLPERSGWYRAKPAFKSPIHSIQGYVLNLFDLVDRQHVIDNTVKPLTTPSGNLDAMLTVQKYPFPGR